MIMQKLIKLELFCLSIKIITTALFRSLKVVLYFWEKKGEIIMSNNKMFLKKVSGSPHATLHVIYIM